MAQGKPPYFNLCDLDVLRKIQFENPPTLKDPSKWSKCFIKFIEACLQKDPSKRPDASRLLSEHTEFFELSQPPEYLTHNLLNGVPSVLERVSILIKGLVWKNKNMSKFKHTCTR